jgi:hypothetical protein
MSILRDPRDEIQLPVRPYGGATILRRIKHEHNGFVASLVAFSSSATLRIMDRVEQNVLSDKIDPKNFADAFIRDLNMLALIAALIAQLSITAFALPMLSGVHWVCKAGLAGSLSFGALAAWFSSNMARNLSSLDSAEDVKSWLSKPAGEKVLKDFCNAYVVRLKDIEAASDEQKRVAKEDIISFVQDNKWKQASYSSCFLLALPSVLLNLSVTFFLIALAVYLGDVWRSKLDPVAGDIPSRAVFICYTIALGCALSVFSWACSRKDAELHSLRNLISQLKDT